MTTEATERRLRDAVLAAPEDDIPRLQYADWAATVGDPRAELIRTQCALAATQSPSARMTLRARERRLLRAHYARWTAPLKTVAYRYKFDRGFIGALQLFGKGFAGLPAVLADEPVTRLAMPHVKGKRALWETALALPGIERVRWFRVLGGYDGFNSEDLKVILNAPFAGLRALLLGGCGMRASTTRLLSQTPSLAGLRTLSLSGNPSLDDEALAHLLDDACVFSLEGLYVSRTAVTGEIAAMLARSSKLPSLRYLAASRTGFDDASAEVLAQTPGFSGLRMLDLMGTKLTERGALLLAGSENLGAMMRLDLRSTPAIRDAKVRAALRARFGSVVRFDGWYAQPVRKGAENEGDEGERDDGDE